MNVKRTVESLSLLMLAVFLGGCATKTKVDWSGRIGQATYDDIVRELGPPERETTLSDGSRVGDWLTARGPVSTTFQSFPSGWTTQGITHQFPDRHLRMTFDKDGKLAEWKRVYR